MFQRFLTIALATLIETIRQPIYHVILVVTGILMVLNVSLALFTLDDDAKLFLDLGLSTLMLSGLFLAAFSASSVVTREIENKTVLTVMSKPVNRPIFMLGKFTGLMIAMSLAFYLSFLVFMLAVRHGMMSYASDPWDAPVLTFGLSALGLSLIAGAFCNFFYSRHFPTTTLAFVTPLLTLAVLIIGKFDEKWEIIPFGSNYVGGQVIIAGYLVFLIVMIITAVALAVSTRFGQVTTLVICTLVLGLGIASDSTLGSGAQTSPTTTITNNTTTAATIAISESGESSEPPQLDLQTSSLNNHIPERGNGVKRSRDREGAVRNEPRASARAVVQVSNQSRPDRDRDDGAAFQREKTVSQGNEETVTQRQPAAQDQKQPSPIATLAYRAVPNIGVFWVIDGLYAESEETTITGSYVAYTTAYALLITIAALSIGICTFQRRELG